ncbi:hypothetical protein R3P38DRAFT_3207275 [Favolaschia claudopus]|uniref:Uncharacterized protein n=1 Tax=Favolaschia claudopus TaxID=2862362 RepID=A0AAW0AKH4_9AGAR
MSRKGYHVLHLPGVAGGRLGCNSEAREVCSAYLARDRCAGATPAMPVVMITSWVSMVDELGVEDGDVVNGDERAARITSVWRQIFLRLKWSPFLLAGQLQDTRDPSASWYHSPSSNFRRVWAAYFQTPCALGWAGYYRSPQTPTRAPTSHRIDDIVLLPDTGLPRSFGYEHRDGRASMRLETSLEEARCRLILDRPFSKRHLLALDTIILYTPLAICVYWLSYPDCATCRSCSLAHSRRYEVAQGAKCYRWGVAYSLIRPGLWRKTRSSGDIDLVAWKASKQDLEALMDECWIPFSASSSSSSLSAPP